MRYLYLDGDANLAWWLVSASFLHSVQVSYNVSVLSGSRWRHFIIGLEICTTYTISIIDLKNILHSYYKRLAHPHQYK